MSSVHENALIILRILDSFGATFGSDVKGYEVKAKIGLSDEEYDQAETYLLNAGYIEGTMGGLEGRRWLTDTGIEYLAQAMQGRMLVNLHAERLARYMFNQGPRIRVFLRDRLQQHLDLEDKEYEEAAQELCDKGLAESKLSTGVFLGDLRLTAEGRNAVRSNFRRTVPAQVQRVGAIIQGPVIGSNIQAVAEAYQSNVEQAISGVDPEALRKTLSELVDQIAEIAARQLAEDELETYMKVVEDFSKEVHKDKPSAQRLHRLASALGFMADVEGAVEFGEKAVKLAALVAPYLVWLYQGLARLIDLI